MICDIRVRVRNGYGVLQEYSVDLWQGRDLPSHAYVVPHDGCCPDSRPIRRGTKVYARVIAAAKAEVAAKRRAKA